MKALVDFDILCYEIGFASEVGWKAITGDELSIPPFDYVAELVDNKIKNIVGVVGANSLEGYLTASTGNFREEIATIKPYKGNRKLPKPFHYKNIRAYLTGKHNAILVEGMEADDAMAIEQIKCLNNGIETIICTRDKDLRMVPGWHYGWELANQPSFGPEFVDEIGYLKLEDKKLKGTGLSFFYAQCLMGDSVDNIQGIPKLGPQKAFKKLSHLSTHEELFKAVREAYIDFYEDVDEAEKYLLENGQLLWMVRELDKEGNPVMWKFPFKGDKDV